MSRRNARNSRRGAAPTTAPYVAPSYAAIITASGGLPCFTADNIDQTGGKLVSWIDLNDPTNLLTQATGANQCALPAPHADFSGVKCATWTGVENYASNKAASFWDVLHNGDAMAIAVLTYQGVGTGVFLVAETTFSDTIGFTAYFLGGTTFLHSISRTGATSQGLTRTLVSTPIQVAFGTDGANRFLKRTGVAETSGALGGSSSTPAETTLRFGGRSATIKFVGRIQGLYMCPRANQAAMQTAIQAITGIAA